MRNKIIQFDRKVVEIKSEYNSNWLAIDMIVNIFYSNKFFNGFVYDLGLSKNTSIFFVCLLKHSQVSELDESSYN